MSLTTLKGIYKISWFESKRHRVSHTDMFYNRAEHTEWAFNRGNDIVRVEYIMVEENSDYHQSAVNNSKNIEEKNTIHISAEEPNMENIPKAIKEFNEFRYSEEDIYTKSKWKGDWDDNNAVLLISSYYVCDSKEEEDSCHINYYTKYGGSERFNEWLDKYNFETEWESECILYIYLKK